MCLLRCVVVTWQMSRETAAVSAHVLCTPVHTTTCRFTVPLHSKSCIYVGCMCFSCNLPPAPLPELPGSFTSYCSNLVWNEYRKHGVSTMVKAPCLRYSFIETIRLIRGGEKGWMGVWRSGKREIIYNYRYIVTTRMTPALRWAAMRAISMFDYLKRKES